jgi:uncharacterized membrane protein YhiD involved in acid resistance
MKRSPAIITLILIGCVFAAVVVVSFAVEYVDAPQTATPSMGTPQATPGGQGNPFTDTIAKDVPAKPGETSFLSILQVIRRLLLAVILSGILAFRPRQNVPLFGRSLFVSQTQILLAVVAAALMMIVGDNAARAFAIFAAVSLVRFRTNIRDPKEVTVLLISLSLGLAAGVGHWQLGIALCLFSLAVLWLLEFRESEQSFRSMELTVKTRDVENTQDRLTDIFRREGIEAELREIVPVDEKKPFGSVCYYLNLRIGLTTDKLSDEILGNDDDTIEGIQWSKTKNAADIYQ